MQISYEKVRLASNLLIVNMSIDNMFTFLRGWLASGGSRFFMGTHDEFEKFVHRPTNSGWWHLIQNASSETLKVAMVRGTSYLYYFGSTWKYALGPPSRYTVLNATAMPLICDRPNEFRADLSWVFKSVLQTSRGVVIAEAIAPAIAPEIIWALGLYRLS